MALLPVLPIIGGESLTSYLARVARFHGGVDVYRFLSLIELSRHDAMLPEADVIERISALTGQPAEVISRMTFQRHGARMRSICGEPIYAEFANLDQTSYCPECLLEDSRTDSPSRGARVGRVAWMIEPMRACRRHRISLVRRKNSASVEKFQLMADVAPDDRALEAQVGSAERCGSSTLLDYIENRLAGEQGPLWLDGQQIDLAARACEMLGLILTAGTHVNMKTVTQSEWIEAGSVGYDFASRGDDGLREGFHLAFERFLARGLKGGPQKVFGRLYQWLQFNKASKSCGPIREVLREFILDNFPVEAGADLLGSPVDRQRVHSVFSLARKTGEHQKTVNRAAVLTGLIDGDPLRLQAHHVFDASTGEDLIHRIRNSISVLRLSTTE